MSSSEHLTTPHAPRPTPPIAEVVFNLPIERSFHYLIPEPLRDTLQPGMRVSVPFGPRQRIGLVTQCLARSPIRHLKPIRRVIDPRPVISDERWALAQWMSEYYACSLGEALFAMVPSTLRLPRVDAPEAAAAPGDFPTTRFTLSSDQRQAFEAIGRAIDQRRAQALLLYGVTASGKTELYLQAIERVLEQGRSAICLVPEIALTLQTVERFTARFGHLVAVWHSRLRTRQRAQAWTDAAAGRRRIVIGTRSAVFAPLPQLGALILDEEHETSYKQEDAPRYHARDVAMARARLVGATVILGSATPSIESFHAAQEGRMQLLHLPQRIEGRPLPRVEIIDMRQELSGRRRFAPLSNRLERALLHTVERGEQAMLLLNRRGFARSVQCRLCGAVARCTRCEIPLIYHAGGTELRCHYCGLHRDAEEVCTQCRKGPLRFRGAGTERVESELHRLFPSASIARMDRDTTAKREAHRMLYEAVRDRAVGLLVGTQMIAKGFDFPQVTLVGVVSADSALNLPDFRAGERTFDLLTQMAGRAGRGEQAGRVMIQTYCPDHYAIQAARHHDYRRFYEDEIAMRRNLRLPPFSHVIELTVLGASQAKVTEAAQALAERLRKPLSRMHTVLLGPAPHRIPRLRRAYRVCIVLQGKSVERMVKVLRDVLEPGRKFRGLPVIVDVDPR
ncbi:MAG: primosomal protein N' [Candidatus Omnitrophica bacterium CG11_big_fil_rev_8_21_14_0_20_63_9]|nr:MAG: primosomal protein N' [Candidatus Omnitrophica bacterium CG11_big_fil_rev_8_21_14_0_20_63_9]